MLTRIIPALLLNDGGFYKTTKFKHPVYLGDPLNILKIFNEKEVDEIVVLDIGATPEDREPDFEFLRDMASECFMPLAYGGGLKTLAQISRLFQIGFEKVVINSAALDRPAFIREAASIHGNQSVVVCIDAKRSLLGSYSVVSHGGKRDHRKRPEEWAREAVDLGAGEIIINSVSRDGTMSGYDLELIKRVTAAVDVPVVACGGAKDVPDFSAAINEGGASACAAGAMFVFQGPHRAVLINVPSPHEIEARITLDAQS